MGEYKASREQNTPQPARKVAAVVVPLLGLIAVIVGVIVAWPNQQQQVGWFAYAPLSDTMFMGDNGSFVSRKTQLGVCIAGVGLLVLAFWAGLRIGQDR
jgi:heme/copper-type cytochrome/quinol oxidase subunit 1